MVSGRRAHHEFVDRRDVVRWLRVGGGAWVKRSGCVGSSHLHDTFGVNVVRFQVVVGKRPVAAHAVGRFQFEVIGREARGVCPPAVCSAAVADGEEPGFFFFAADECVFAINVAVALVGELPGMRAIGAPFDQEHAGVGETREVTVEEEH